VSQTGSFFAKQLHAIRQKCDHKLFHQKKCDHELRNTRCSHLPQGLKSTSQPYEKSHALRVDNDVLYLLVQFDNVSAIRHGSDQGIIFFFEIMLVGMALSVMDVLYLTVLYKKICANICQGARKGWDKRAEDIKVYCICEELTCAY
jgi:hypothetical protein